MNLGAARLRIAESDSERVVEVDDGSGGNITAPPVITAERAAAGAERRRSRAHRCDSLSRFRSSAKPKRRISLSPLRLALGAVAVVAAVVLWFIFTATSVSMRTNPTAANVAFPAGCPPCVSEIACCCVQAITMSAPSWRAIRRRELQIKVTKAPNQQFALTLAKLPGRLRIEVPSAARVTVDGKEAGNAPGEFELKAGRHSVAIAAERYQPFTAEVDVEGLGKTQTFKPQLVPGWGVVTVTSEPAGAQLLVNGEPRGVTPLDAQIMAGAHPVELRLEGFKPWTTDIQVKANEPLTLGPVKLGLPDGRLAVRSDPPGASVSVAGVYRGQTPIELELRPDLGHSIVLTRPGYEAVTRQVSLGAGEQRTLSVPLTGVFGEVAVRAQPADAQVFVDGKASGAANQTLRLVATTHEIEIRKAGLRRFQDERHAAPGRAAERRDHVADAGADAHRRDARGSAQQGTISS